MREHNPHKLTNAVHPHNVSAYAQVCVSGLHNAATKILEHW